MRILMLAMLTVSALVRANPFGMYNTSATSALKRIHVESRVSARFSVVACRWWHTLAYACIAVPPTGEPCLLALLKRVVKIALPSLSAPCFYLPPPTTPAGHGLPYSTSNLVSQPSHASPETCRVPRIMRHGDSESHNIKNHES